MRQHISRWSCDIHHRLWPGPRESICSHAWREQHFDWRWLLAREALDLAALLATGERDHCLRANEAHWPRACSSSQSA